MKKMLSEKLPSTLSPGSPISAPQQATSCALFVHQRYVCDYRASKDLYANTGK